MSQQMKWRVPGSWEAPRGGGRRQREPQLLLSACLDRALCMYPISESSPSPHSHENVWFPLLYRHEKWDLERESHSSRLHKKWGYWDSWVFFSPKPTYSLPLPRTYTSYYVLCDNFLMVSSPIVFILYVPTIPESCLLFNLLWFFFFFPLY